MQNFYCLSPKEALTNLNSSYQGLSQQEAGKRFVAHPDIEIRKKNSMLTKFFAQFKDLMIIILLAAALLSIIIGSIEGALTEILDGAIILAIVLMNAVFGLVQENKAEKSLEALQKLTEPEAVVLRDGEPKKINAKDVVIGDIVVLEAGAIVPADVRIIESVSLEIDESSLTGESVAAYKNSQLILKENVPLADRHNMAYRGCNVTNGRGLGVVCAVGKDTEIGKIAVALKEVDKESTPLQKNIKEVGKILTFLVLAMAAMTFFLEVVARPGNILEAFLTAVAISVAAIPESMPAVITIIMSLGVARLAKQKAVVKHMHSVETLGCCDVICSDKTGTITQNKMTVVAGYYDGQISNKFQKTESFELFIKALLLCNDTKKARNRYVGDPTEIALADFGRKINVDKAALEKICPRYKEIPFDSRRKLMTTGNLIENKKFVFCKGALDSILTKCSQISLNGRIEPLTKNIQDSILTANLSMSQNALRVLAVAYKPDDGAEMESNLIFLGLVGMIDPPRKAVEASVKKCKNAGMRVVMITGDHKETAFAIAKKVGIVSNRKEVMTGEELTKIDDEKLGKTIEHIGVFARVSPEDKVRIVDALKKRGHIVAMTGDGVNDAPSLKHANIGIGMGQSGTDVTKEVADLIVTDDNFSTIVIAVEEGRKIYQNIQKTVKFLFSANMGEMLSLFFATIFFPNAIFLYPVQILFVNLITDSLPAIALGVEKPEKNLMESPPRSARETLFSNGTGWAIVLLGLVQTVLTLGAYTFGLFLYNQHVAVTMAFYTLNIIQMFYLASMRTNGSIFKSAPHKNKFFLLALAFCFGLLGIMAFTPFGKILKLVDLNALQWLVIFALSLIMMFVSEIYKLAYKKFRRKRG